jgi:hypothetical protein
MQGGAQNPPPDLNKVNLEYAPGAPVRRRRRIRRLGAACLVLAIIALAIWRGPSALQRIRHAWYLYQVMHYHAPEGLVVYEEDPNRAAALLRQDPAYRTLNNNPALYGQNGNLAFTSYFVRAITQLDSLGEILPDEPLFVGVRKSPGGLERLVIIAPPYNGMRAGPQGASGDVQVSLYPISATFGGNGLNRGVGSCFAIGDRSIADKAAGSFYVRCYAGQADPADSSHFTIRYEIDKQSGIIDGYLLDDGSIKLGARGFGPPAVQKMFK